MVRHCPAQSVELQATRQALGLLSYPQNQLTFGYDLPSPFGWTRLWGDTDPTLTRTTTP